MKKLNENDEIKEVEVTGNTVGLDLGDRWTRFCVLDQRGTIVKEDRVRTTLEALKEHFAEIVLPENVMSAPSRVIDAQTRSRPDTHGRSSKVR
jgi:hypothetical protein